MAPLFLITLPITLSINLAVRGYKYKKGRTLKQNINDILTTPNHNCDPSVVSKHKVIATFPVEVKTGHLVSGSRVKDIVRTQIRHIVIIQLYTGEHLILAFRKQFWDAQVPLESIEFIAANLKHLDIRFHAHNGSAPLFMETCDFKFTENEDGKQCVVLQALDDNASAWYHRNKEWSLMTNDSNNQQMKSVFDNRCKVPAY